MQISDIKQINPINKDFVEVVYGDSVTGDTMISTKEGYMSIEEMYNDGYNSKEENGKEYVKSFIKVKSPYGEYNNIKYIMRHKTHKNLYWITTQNNNHVKVTEDHSLMVCKSELYNKEIDLFIQLQELSPKETEIGDYVLTSQGVSIITNIKDLGIYEDYVYDICVDTDDETQHVFYANDILVHNTDSLYLSYEGLLNTIEGVEKWSIEDKTKFIVKLNQEFLDVHNKQYIKEYYETRFADSIHDFELETVALSGVWLDVKKRYAQILLWKDGKYYDEDDLPMKVKGLEMVKSSYPKQAREGLKRLVRYFLEDQSQEYLIHRLNLKAQEEKDKWMLADIEDICENKGIQNYTKYILDDNNMYGLQVAPKCPYNVRALGNYNNIRNVNNLPGDPLYGGKMKIYQVVRKAKKSEDEFFAFQSRNYPKWAEQYAPIDKNAQYRKFLLEPFNRILSAVGVGELNVDGSIQMSLF